MKMSGIISGNPTGLGEQRNLEIFPKSVRIEPSQDPHLIQTKHPIQ